MPDKRVKPDRLLEEALEALTHALTKCQAPWMVIGGIAVIARGVRRFTTDIPDIDRSRVRQRVEELSALAEAPEMVTALDELLART